MKKRSLALRAVTVAVVAALSCTTALPALAAPQTTTGGGVAAAVTGGPEFGWTPPGGAPGYWGVAASIKSSGGVGLTFETDDNIFTADYDVPPTNIASGGQTGFYMSQNDGYGAGSYGSVAAEILFNGSPTGYFARFYASNWSERKFNTSCDIYLGNPRLGGTVPALTPYFCSEADNYTPEMQSPASDKEPWRINFAVDPVVASTVTDPVRQKRILYNSCTVTNENCIYQPTLRTTGDSPTYVVEGSVVSNTTNVPVNYTVKLLHKFTQSDSVGGSISASVSILDTYKVAVEATYDHEWSDTRQLTQVVEMEVPPLYKSWYTMGVEMETITGDFLVRENDRLYRLQNVTVTTPVPDGSSAIVAHNSPFLLPLAPRK